ncbi:MAG: AbrB/MazE/SpoVT family DNA-binding domain-containing protein [Anaerocolumna sp.]|jgi:transcriptional pleiotropic regulator of transition state genes|nr:transcriptional regulator, AbrB family [Anaerocolumna sp.]HAQ39557.1 AbrB family transcriptional regulator [Clostridiales bacterium]
MKSTGIVRKLDELGRITLPIELRRTLGVSERDPLEIFVDEDRIILKKYEPTDIFNGSKDNLIDYCGKKISKESILELAKLAGIVE